MRLLSALLLLLNLALASGCDNSYVADVTVSMPKHRWSYINKVVAEVDIKDHTKTYDLFLTLRHTAAYRYGNIYILFHYQEPGKKPVTTRYEYQLAARDGRWLGAGSGNLYSYQLPLHKAHRFPRNGIYKLEIEQSMVDNPLHAISDAGISVIERQD